MGGRPGPLAVAGWCGLVRGDAGPGSSVAMAAQATRVGGFPAPGTWISARCGPNEASRATAGIEAYAAFHPWWVIRVGGAPRRLVMLGRLRTGTAEPDSSGHVLAARLADAVEDQGE